jgi:hypothetical protein
VTAPDGLFPEPEHDGLDPAELEAMRPAERRRIRLLEAMTRGQHPLGVALRSPIRLHDNAVRTLEAGDGGPRCGGCRFRTPMTHNAKSYPKCAYGPQERRRVDGAAVYRWKDYPRSTNGEGTDIRAYWPACAQYEPG